MEREDILKTLEPLFERAEAEGLWFHCGYQDLWFSPKELKEWQAEGKFIWGLPNWELRNPREKIDGLERLKSNIDIQIRDFEKRIKSE